MTDRRPLAPHVTTQEAAALRRTGAAPLRPVDPRRVGPYVPVALLGSGGMGRVYLARLADDGPGLFAVKVIRPEYAEDPPFRERFAREALVHERVRTHRTPTLSGTGFEDELLWMATAYLPAFDLAEYVKEDGPLPLPAVWRLVAELGGALVDLAETAIVHRDLKPSNVLLSLHGVHLIDFGISKALDASSITGTGARVGTPAYMSPEYLRTGKCDPASDLFSLAGTLAYALTGRAPFGDGTGVDVMHRVAFEPPNPEVMGEVETADPDLAALLLRCLSKDPRLRPAPGALTEAAADRAETPAVWPEPLKSRVLARQEAYDVLHHLPAERVAGLRSEGMRPPLVSLVPPAPSTPAPTPVSESASASASVDAAAEAAAEPDAVARPRTTEAPSAGGGEDGTPTNASTDGAGTPADARTDGAGTSADGRSASGSGTPDPINSLGIAPASGTLLPGAAAPETPGPPATHASARALPDNKPTPEPGTGSRTQPSAQPGAEPGSASAAGSGGRTGVRTRPVLLGAAAGVTVLLVAAGVFLAVRPEGPPPSAAPEASATTAPGKPAASGTGGTGRDGREGDGPNTKTSGGDGAFVHGDGEASPAPSASRGRSGGRGGGGGGGATGGSTGNSGGGSTQAPGGGTTAAPRPEAPATGGATEATTPAWVTDCHHFSGNGRTQRGDQGKKVLEVQCILTKRGYSVGSGGVSGNFDAGTEAAVRAFQSARGLTADGVVGRSTWGELRATT